MLRREWLGFAAAGLALGQAARKARGPKREAATGAVIASATEDATPRVAIVPSSFKGSEDHDGTVLKGLRNPVAPDAALTGAQLEEMVRKAIELGNTRHGGLASIVEDGDWVVVKPRIAVERDAAGKRIAGSVADPRIVRTLIRWIAGRRAVTRVTIAEAPSPAEAGFDPWSSDWDGAFGKTTYRGVAEELAREFPKVRIDIVDLGADELMEMQTPARAGTPGPGYRIPATLIRCSTLISVAPLATDARTGAMLSVGSYLRVLPSAERGAQEENARGTADLASMLVDVFSFHPPEYAILGGEWAREEGGAGAPATVKHNIVIAGANAVAVDAAAAAVMGFEPGSIPHLELASRRGYGTTNPDSIWTRGAEIEVARRRFRATPH